MNIIEQYEAAMTSGNVGEFLKAHAKLWPFIRAALEAAQEMDKQLRQYTGDKEWQCQRDFRAAFSEREK